MGAIVVGYVPKPEGEAALLRAVEECRLRGLELLIVNSQREGDDNTEWAHKTEADLATARDRLDASGIPYEIRRQIDDGADGHGAAEELVAIAEDVDAELVVIGVRRRSPVGKLILGTQAQRILLDAPCPVLAVKG